MTNSSKVRFSISAPRLLANPVPEDQQEIHECGPKWLEGIFMRYVQKAGGGWTGELWVLDREELEKATRPNSMNARKFLAPEVQVTKIEGKVRLPAHLGEWKQQKGGKTGAQKRTQANADEPEEEPETVTDSDREVDQDFEKEDQGVFSGDCLHRIYLKPWRKLFNLAECEPPFPIGFLDDMRSTQTDLLEDVEEVVRDHWSDDFYIRKGSERILCNMDG